MGCSNSLEQTTTKNKKKKHVAINNHLNLTKQSFQIFGGDNTYAQENNSDEETYQNLKVLLYPSKEKKLKRQAKKSGRQFRVDDSDKEITENIIRKERDKTVDDLAIIVNSFQRHYFLYNLTGPSMEHIIMNMFYCEQKSGQILFAQGDKGTCYFVISSGEVEILKDEKSIKTLEVGASFGELALLHNQPRLASIKTRTDCGFWALDRHTFRECVETINAQVYQENREFMDEVEFFSLISTQQRDSIAHTLLTTKYVAGEIIVQQGEPADTYYVIKHGQVKIMKNETEINRMGPKQGFGEQALFASSLRLASVVAVTDVECIALTRESLQKILGDKVQSIIFNNLIKTSLERNSVLSRLSHVQLERIINSAKITPVSARFHLVSVGQLLDSIVVLLDGSGETSLGDKFEKGLVLGDKYLLDQDHHKFSQVFYTMNTDGVAAIIPYEAVNFVVGGSLKNSLRTIENCHELKIQQLPKKEMNCSATLENLLYLKKIGSGQFGSVYLVADPSNKNKLYALKVVPKIQIVQNKYDRHLLWEKEVMMNINFPFIVSLEKYFVDDYSFYFLEEYIRGQDLFNCIRDLGLLGKHQAQFYIANMILILEYLHSQHILYRDLKPENLIVDDLGYLKLIDFGASKQLEPKSIKRTSTIIGTPHYMAPEIVVGQTYTYSADLWSLGICMYEFISGGLPYGENVDDPYVIYEEILGKQLTFPSFIRDKTVKKLNEQLLNLTPGVRLGASYAQLKANRYFDEIDWDKLYSQEIKAPHKVPNELMISNAQIESAIKQRKLIWTELFNHYYKQRETIQLDIDEHFRE